MNSIDSSDFTIIPATNTRLLSESPLLRPALDSREDDLSLSELALADRPGDASFRSEHEAPNADDIYEAPEQREQGDIDPEEEARIKRQTAKMREEKLQHDLFLLKKLNGAFALYTDALRATQSSTERLKDRVKDTNALLDKYIGMLDRSEAVTKLILDERWHGADADEDQLLRQRAESEEKMRKEAEERELEEKKERERIERELQDQREREEEHERIEKERREKQPVRGGLSSGAASESSSGVRGVRGTRASMRARGVVRGSSAAAPVRGTTRVARPPSSTRGSMTSRARGS